MLRLSTPASSFENVIDLCHAGITGNAVLAHQVADAREQMIAMGEVYVASCQNGRLYQLVPAPPGEADPIVFGRLRKSDLVKLYDQYLLGAGKPARQIYEELLVSARERCPFCGGIGRPRNIDHFLPKSRFPQFSILPVNLVPSCRDCNMDGKAARIAVSAEDQIIHPYWDETCFFDVQWIFARFESDIFDPQLRIEYFVCAPAGWSVVDRARAIYHFAAFDLPLRYALKASEHAGVVQGQIRRMQSAGVSNSEIIDFLLQPGIESAGFPNHWRVGLYQAFIASL